MKLFSGMKHMKARILWALLALFMVCSFLFISPQRKEQISSFHSSQLQKKTVREGNTERTDYVDADGKTTTAADLRYATLIVTRTENSILEQYYDDKGEPISRYNGNFALLREYDESGNNTRITYLDQNGEPMIMANGYATEELEYNENRKVVSVKYYDVAGNPACTPSYGYGKINEYDENGNACRVIYVDAYGAPMMTRHGYAIVCRNYYVSDGPENGRAESEFYYDETGNPVCLSLGEYGVHMEYDQNGRKTVLTYLDAEGKPMKTNKGYTTVRRTFQANNNVATERYFDLEGNPISLSEGQYGIKKEYGQTIYLNENGSEAFNLKNLLYNQSMLVIVFALMVVALAVLLGKMWNALLLLINIGTIVYLTLMFRESGGVKVNLELFWSYKSIFDNSENRADILRNIWLFIPLGAILYRLCPKKIVLFIPIALSIIVEVIQYFSGTGLCELDDVVSNGIGGVIGFELGRMLCNLKDSFIKMKYDSYKRICRQ